jgi:endoglucanase
MSRIGRVLGALVALAGVIGPAGAAHAATVACEVDYRPSPYTGGFTAAITVTNVGDVTIRGWTFRFPLDATVADFWNADLITPTGVVVTRAKDWNAVVEPGNSISLGFRAVGTAGAGPAWFTVNEIVCEPAG